MSYRVPRPEVLLWAGVVALSAAALSVAGVGGAWVIRSADRAVESRREELREESERAAARAAFELRAWLEAGRELGYASIPEGLTAWTVSYRSTPAEPRSRELLEAEQLLVTGHDPRASRRALAELLDGPETSPADRVRALRHLARLSEADAPALLRRALSVEEAPGVERCRALFELARIEPEARSEFVAELASGFVTVPPGERAYLAEQLPHDVDPAALRPLWLLEELLDADETDRLRPAAALGGEELAWIAAEVGDRHTIAHGPAHALGEHFLPGLAERRWSLRPAGAGFVLPAPFPALTLTLGERSLEELAAAGRSARWRGGGTIASVIALLLAAIAASLASLFRRRRVDSHQNDFLYAVTHELKTPLATISLSAETLLEHGESDPAAVPRFSRMIVDEAERLRVRIQQVLDVAAGRQQAVDPAGSFDSGELLHAVVADYLPGARESGVDLELMSLDTCPELRGSSELFAQAVGGLLENAIKFSRKGVVKVVARVEGATFSVFVHDQGPGVPARDVERIFEPFVRLGSEATREVDGTGLGLTLVRQCASALKGRVQAVEKTGPGAVFRLDFPCDPQVEKRR